MAPDKPARYGDETHLDLLATPLSDPNNPSSRAQAADPLNELFAHTWRPVAGDKASHSEQITFNHSGSGGSGIGENGREEFFSCYEIEGNYFKKDGMRGRVVGMIYPHSLSEFKLMGQSVLLEGY